MKRARSVSGDATTALGGSAAGAKRRSGGLSGLLRDALAASTQQVHAMVPRARRAKAQRTYAHEQTVRSRFGLRKQALCSRHDDSQAHCAAAHRRQSPRSWRRPGRSCRR